jgi:hypothetical protein
MSGAVIFLGIVALCIFYTKYVVEWFAALILAGVAAWFTTETHGIAPLGQFELWFIADYILVQWLFVLLNKRANQAKV